MNPPARLAHLRPNHVIIEWIATSDVGNLKLIVSPNMVLFICTQTRKSCRQDTTQKSCPHQCKNYSAQTETMRTTEKMFNSAKNTTFSASEAAMVNGSGRRECHDVHRLLSGNHRQQFLQSPRIETQNFNIHTCAIHWLKIKCSCIKRTDQL